MMRRQAEAHDQRPRAMRCEAATASAVGLEASSVRAACACACSDLAFAPAHLSCCRMAQFLELADSAASAAFAASAALSAEYP